MSAPENEIWAAKLKATEGAVGEIKAILSIVYRVRLPLGFSLAVSNYQMRHLSAAIGSWHVSRSDTYRSTTEQHRRVKRAASATRSSIDSGADQMSVRRAVTAC